MWGWGIGAIAGLVASVTQATVLLPMRDETLVARSELVVVGTVERIESVLLAGPRVVTRVTLAVERTVKGDPGGPTVVVTEPGGTAGRLRVGVPGTPSFAVGEHVLAFLRRRVDGSLVTTAMALGKYTIAAALDGSVTARRRAAVPDERPLELLLGRVVALAAGAPVVRTDGRAGVAVEAPLAWSVADRFTLITDDQGVGARWFEADCGFPITLAQGGAAADYAPATSEAAVAAGAAVWTGVPTASIALTVGPPIAPTPSALGGTIDGRNVVLFDDPFGEVEDFDPGTCEGVLAVAQFVAASDPNFVELNQTIDGQQYGKIFEADVVLNAGHAACSGDPLLLDEVVGHEVGHAIGLGHSSEDPAEANPLLEGALMYFAIHGDGRGAVANVDDVAGVSTTYPTSALPTDAVGQVACEVRLGILDVSCFLVPSFPARPFRRYAKAFAAAGKARSAPRVGKQKKLLRKASRSLAVAEKAAEGVAGECGAAMRARIRRYGERIAETLATL